MSGNDQVGGAQLGEAIVACGPHAPRLARTLVLGWLDGRGDPRLQADACLLVSELVSNSVRHADQPTGVPLRLRAAAVGGVVRVEVDDAGHGAVRRRAPAGEDGGFGLQLVERIAARWGVNHRDGTQVWFELAS